MPRVIGEVSESGNRGLLGWTGRDKLLRQWLRINLSVFFRIVHVSAVNYLRRARVEGLESSTELAPEYIVRGEVGVSEISFEK